MKQIEYNKFIDLLRSQSCYFINTYEEAVIRSVLKDNEITYFVKFKGDKEEEKAEDDSIIVGDAIREHTTISKEEYEGY